MKSTLLGVDCCSSQIKQLVRSSQPWRRGGTGHWIGVLLSKSLQEYLILCAFDDMLAGCRTPSQTQHELKRMVNCQGIIWNWSEKAEAACLSEHSNSLFIRSLLQLVTSQKRNKKIIQRLICHYL